VRRKALLELRFSDLPTVAPGQIAVCAVDATFDYLTYPCLEYDGAKLSFVSRSWTLLPHHESALLSMFCFASGIGRVGQVVALPRPGRSYAFAPGGLLFATPWRRCEIWESPNATEAVWRSVGERPSDRRSSSRWRA
jgi:hypothetical protein